MNKIATTLSGIVVLSGLALSGSLAHAATPHTAHTMHQHGTLVAKKGNAAKVKHRYHRGVKKHGVKK